MKRDYKIQNGTNEIMTFGSKIESTKIQIPFIVGSLSICKIICEFYNGNFGYRDLNDKKTGSGTGFFIKFKDPKSQNRYKYFVITCEHVIQKEIIESEPIKLKILYFYENYLKSFSFNKSQRFIKEYRTDFNIDVTIV